MRKNHIVVAYNHSDSIEPNFIIYKNAKELESDLKNWVQDYLANAENAEYEVDDFATDSEIEEFVAGLYQARYQRSLNLVKDDDLLCVATALVLGGSDKNLSLVQQGN